LIEFIIHRKIKRRPNLPLMIAKKVFTLVLVFLDAKKKSDSKTKPISYVK